ncbi:hypothetical protein WJX74_004630 [Apatococcus lobatus]|uniref:SLY1 protein n=1 Tax=Apatococcus lobatus TaxID=904363 RepID=A0AAW1QM89_9CHLO
MVLNVRKKQIEAVERMLHFHAQPGSQGRLSAGGGLGSNGQTTPEEEAYKVLILDAFTKDLLAPLLKVSELRRHGVTMHLQLHQDRQPIADAPAIYFVQATAENIQRIVADGAQGLYDVLHLNFVHSISRQLMEQLAGGLVKTDAAQRIAKVHDMYLSFSTLEAGLFCLNLPEAYRHINEPTASEAQIEAVISDVVDGLFSTLASQSIVPIIRCPKAGAAQHLRSHDHILVLFDRNFELSVMLQHPWTYKPLVHDVLGLALNKVTVEAPEPAGAASTVLKPPPKRQTFEVGEADFFWEASGAKPFPDVVTDLDQSIAKYKQAIEDLNRRTGADVDPNADPNELMQANTRGLMSAVASLPELTERKRTIDKHTAMLTKLLDCIKNRGLDKLYSLEDSAIQGKCDLPGILSVIQGSKGTSADKLRLAIIYILTVDQLPGQADADRMQQLLEAAGADLSAWTYALRMRRMNLMGRSQGVAPVASSSASSLEGLGGFGSVSGWADKAFGQGLSSITKGVKTLLGGEQLTAVTLALDTIMEGRALPENDPFMTFDPKAAPGRAGRGSGPAREAIVFMIGGGNYIEYDSLQAWAQRSQPAKSIVYGSTDLPTGEIFVKQLADLGRLTPR